LLLSLLNAGYLLRLGAVTTNLLSSIGGHLVTLGLRQA
jgi:hypothetical protein